MNDDCIKGVDFVAHDVKVNCLSFGVRSNQVFATGGDDNKANVWKLGDTVSVWSFAHKSAIESVCFAEDDQYLLTGARSGALKMFDLSAGQLVRSLPGHSTNITSMNYHPYGEFLVSGAADNLVKVWDVRAKGCQQTYKAHSKEITFARFSPDGKWVGTAGKDGSMMFWDIVAGKLLSTIRLAPNIVTSFEFNPNDFSVAAVTSARNVRIWDLDTMSQRFATPAEGCQVRAVTYGLVSEVMCTASKDVLKIWNVGDSPNRLIRTVETMWGDRMADIRLSDSGSLSGAGFCSNFVSVYSIDLNNAMSEAQEEDEPEVHPPARVDPVTPVSSKAEAKGAPSTPGNNVKPSGGSEKSTGSARLKMMDKVSAQLNQLSEGLAAKPTQGEADIAPSKGNTYEPLEDKLGGGAGAKLQPSEEKSTSTSSSAIKPVVVWEGATSSEDLAASMGDSFWKRNSREKLVCSSVPEEDEEGEGELERGIAAMGVEQREKNDHASALEHLLPPSSFHEGPSRPAVSRASAPQSSSSKAKTPTASQPAPAGIKSRETRIGANNVEISGSEDVLSVIGQRHISNSRPAYHQQQTSSDNILNNHVPPAASAAPKVSAASEGNSNSEYRKCIEQMDKLNSESSSFSSMLSHRLNQLKALKLIWTRGDVLESLDYLTSLSDALQYESNGNLAILVGFFNAVDLPQASLSLDSCTRLLPILQKMLTCRDAMSAESVVVCVVENFTILAELFGELIRSTRSTIAAGGVDLSREARLLKCNNANDIFVQVRNQGDAVKSVFRSRPAVTEVVNRYQKTCGMYFS